MAVRLDKRTLGYAKGLIKERQFVFDDWDAWSEHRPLLAAVSRADQYEHLEVELAGAHRHAMLDALA